MGALRECGKKAGTAVKFSKVLWSCKKCMILDHVGIINENVLQKSVPVNIKEL